MPIPEALQFPTDNLAHFDQARIDRALTESPELYLNHLRIAKHLDSWSESSAADDDADFAQALREVAAHLRQGDYLEDGILLQSIRP